MSDCVDVYNESDEKILLGLIEKLMNNKEYDLLKKLLKYNDVVGNFNTKEMNKRFYV